MSAATPSTALLTVHLTPDVAIVKDAKGINEKQISHEDLVAILSKHVSVGDSGPRQSIRYPFGTIFVERTLNELFIAVYYPGGPHEYTLNIQGKVTKHPILRPNIVLEARLTTGDKHTLSGYCLYCTPHSPDVIASRYQRGMRRHSSTYPDPEMSRGLHVVPFTNVYDNGTMCLGGNSVPSVYNTDDLSGLNRYWDILCNSPGNSDLSIRGVRGPLAEALGSMTSYFKKLGEFKDAFPYQHLA